MFFLNLSAPEFFALLGTLGGVITALYLLDRAKRTKIVSTLRFWTPASSAEDQHRRRHMREPWSFILQLACLALLLLAIAQLQFGSRERRGLDHILLLDTSSWTAEKTSEGTLLDREKRIARQYLSRLAPRDRVMLVRVDGLASPATPFTLDRSRLRNALAESESGFSALNIDQALAFAQQAQSWSAGRTGEIVYIGPALAGESGSAAKKLANLRVIRVAANRENCGILRIGVRRSEDGEDSWHATVTVKNYGSEPRTVRLETQFAGTAFTPRIIRLSAGAEAGAEYEFTTNTAGLLTARLDPDDVLPTDDRASLALPRNDSLRLAVYTSRPTALEPLLKANHRLNVTFYSPAQYVPKPRAEMMLLDQIAPSAEPQLPSLWIHPPANGSPLPVETEIKNAIISNWHSETALAAGLHTKEARIPAAEVFQTFQGDIPVGSIAQGPVVVARGASESRPKLAIIGFDPLNGQLRFEVATPLLFADLLHWLSPEAFRALDITAGRGGALSVALDPSERVERIRVTEDQGESIPFTIQGRTLQLFTSRPGIVRVRSENRDRILSLTLPDIAEFVWTPPRNVRSGLPSTALLTPGAVDIWQFLAVLAGIGLLIEWMLFGRRRAWRLRSGSGTSTGAPPRTASVRESELVSK